jgi:hypothetical protein
MSDEMTTLVVEVAGLVSFVCFVVVSIQMFQHGATALGVTCIVLTRCCGLGGLIAFIYGWVKAGEWKIGNLMTVWTVAFAIDIVASSLNPAPSLSLRQLGHF